MKSMEKIKILTKINDFSSKIMKTSKKVQKPEKCHPKIAHYSENLNLINVAVSEELKVGVNCHTYFS